MSRTIQSIAVCVLVLGLPACGGDGDGEVIECGSLMCGVTQTCDKSNPAAPKCVCRPAYVGSECTSCAPGYTRQPGGDCAVEPVNCQNANACGVRGQCVPLGGTGRDYCACNTGYSGDNCLACASGYQDKDTNGTCTPSCLNPGVAQCNSPMVCTDDTGTARCGCPPGKTGSSCDRCLSGYVLQANGSCLMCGSGATGEGCAQCQPGYTKNADTGLCVMCPAFSTGAGCVDCITGYARDPITNACVAACQSDGQCGANGFCNRASAVPACACKPGFAGVNCAACAMGYAADGAGNCISVSIPAGTTLIGAGTIGGTQTLLAINPSAGTAAPIRPLPANTTIVQLTSDAANKALFALTSNGIHRYDIQTGALTLISANVAQATSLAFATDGLYTVPNASPYLLKRVNPTNGAIADLPATGLSGVQGLAYESGSQSFIAARWGTNSPALYRIPVAGGQAVSIGMVSYDGMPLPPPTAPVGLALEPNTNALYAATRVGRESQAMVREHCAAVIAGVGFAGYEQAMYTKVDLQQAGIGAGMTKTLGSAVSGKEVIVYASQTTRAATPANLRIETANPEAVVCIVTTDENINLVLGANAVFKGVVLTGNRPGLGLTVEGVREVLMPQVHVYVNSQTYAGSVAQYAIAKLYSSQEWVTQKKLPIVSSFFGSDPQAPMVLMQLNTSTLKPIRVVALPGVSLTHLLAPWVP